MSNAHKGSKLILKDNLVPVGFSDSHFDFNNDGSGIQYGNLILPDPTSVYTNRPFEGKFGGGIAVEQGTTNLWTGAMSIYNNFATNGQMTASLTALNETFMGQTVYRLQMTPVSANAVTSVDSYLSGQGVFGSSMTYQSGNTYMASIYWRPQKSDVVVGGTASNIAGWSDVGTYSSNSGWNRSVAKWNYTGNATDNKFWSFRSPSTVANETVVIDWVCPQIEQKVTPTSFLIGTRANGLLKYPANIINPNQGFISFWMYARSDGNNFGGSPNPLFSAGVDPCFDLLISSSGSNYLRAYTSGNSTQIYPHIVFDSWCHVVIVWNRNTLFGAYINGVLDVQNTSPVDWFSYYNNNATGFFLGSGIRSNSNIIISDLRIGQTLPTAEDISIWYTSNKPFYNPYDYRAVAY